MSTTRYSKGDMEMTISMEEFNKNGVTPTRQGAGVSVAIMELLNTKVNNKVVAYSIKEVSDHVGEPNITKLKKTLYTLRDTKKGSGVIKDRMYKGVLHYKVA